MAGGVRTILCLSVAVASLLGACRPAPPPAERRVGEISCRLISPGDPVITYPDTPVRGQVACTNSAGASIALSIAPTSPGDGGRTAGDVEFAGRTGRFTYTPAPAARTRDAPAGRDAVGEDAFGVLASSPDGASTRFPVRIKVQQHLRSCDPDFRPTSTTLFNDPAGKRSAQYRLLTRLVTMIDCTPPVNPDGTPASITISFYSITYAPVRKALVAAARRGVAVRVVTNSHSDRFQAWRDLVRALGSDTGARSFAVTCWQGCLAPREPPQPDGPTAWFTARAASADSRTVAFTDHSRPGVRPITSWSWDFGDGTRATGRGPHRKTYRSQAIFATSLTVRDAAGVIHRTIGNVTVPDSLEPLYPALHAKLVLFSTVGTGRAAQRWVSVYGSGNPTHAQAREGFNNLNVVVGDPELYRVLGRYFDDLVAGSRGALLTPDYYRTAVTRGVAATDAPPTTIHFLPRASGDVQLDVLRSIQCRYPLDGRLRRTKVRIDMFTISRVEIGAELWRMAYERGCSVDLVYTTMTQRLRDPDGAWVRDETGAVVPWGPADCLAIPPTTRAGPGTQASTGTREVPSTIDGPDGLCSGSPLDGRLAGAKPGVLVDRVSPLTHGRLRVRAVCPLVTRYDSMLRLWAVVCEPPQLFTHHKVMLVDGMVHGKVQKYVMTGSANWSQSGLVRNDELVTELSDAPAIHDAYLKAHRHLVEVLAQRP